MAYYYDNLTAEQPWSFRPAFGGDSWISDVFAKETEALTKVLQCSFNSDGDFFSSETVDTAPLQTPTASGGSENGDIPRRRSIPPQRPSSKVAKRKSRPSSKRAAATTFITAAPEDFRHMVQQVTGVRFAGMNGLPSPSVFKQDPLQAGGGCGLPTLDTSAFLLDDSASQPPTAAREGGGAAAPDYYFDSFCSFPTLESSKAV